MEETSQSSARRDQSISKKLIINESLFYLFLKRGIDISASIIGIIVLSPLFLILAIVIKIEDPKGAVFFKQTRVGKDENEFKMYKFRSMVSNAEELLEGLLDQNEVSGAMFKMKADPRITKMGKFIRKTSIDELPQLLNVLKGDMSLVGPRPPLIREVNEYTLFHKQRLLIKPGCTGLWQVSARNNVGFDEMVSMDLNYIKNRNILLDFKIILKTLLVLINTKGAY
ncbi:sugar transferase [Alkalicoccobacillus plakortidis]|uniref:Sugar transferase n=1 Tax=Alkalicoccobacillus plakortidis TaxID=444060 RepID=A0ABT0XJ32_9BACI|nr:sugar transferase [Alkalicoccobacillus plakortidis]MCM2675918.1 sugar transferase [Alkalicoccobacillus plakortidis]